ncbi:uncharacterized protein LOC107272449 isoform X2 [Cephus cinctus]|nr:uncharacterized protein LOC107272449 isoform X2 [Cephus cinctus]
MMNLPSRTEGVNQLRHQGTSGDRTAQLEQNMKFLQEQHQATLVSLHQEVENLRQRNRDLQFQLVFSKGNVCVPSSPSSPEDNGNGFVKAKGSPVCVNLAPLQVELLERDLQDIKASLHEAKTHNLYLSEIIERQKKKLDLVEERKEKLSMADAAIQVGSVVDSHHADLATRLEDAEAMVKCLRRENEDQRREIASLKTSSTNGNSSGNGGRSRGSHNGHHSRGSANSTGQDQTSHKFPPLHTQSFWHRGSRGNHSFDQNSDYHRNGRSRQDKQDREQEVDSTVLPQLRNGNVRLDTRSYPPFYRSRDFHNNGGSYHREGGNRKYRGQRSQRDRREPDSREHRRDYKDRDSKEQHKEYSECGESSRDTKNSRQE